MSADFDRARATLEQLERDQLQADLERIARRQKFNCFLLGANAVLLVTVIVLWFGAWHPICT